MSITVRKTIGKLPTTELFTANTVPVGSVFQVKGTPHVWMKLQSESSNEITLLRLEDLSVTTFLISAVLVNSPLVYISDDTNIHPANCFDLKSDIDICVDLKPVPFENQQVILPQGGI